MMEKTLLQKKQQIIEYNNNYREHRKIEAENRRIANRNTVTRNVSVSECIDAFRKGRGIDDVSGPVFKTSSRSSGERNTMVYIGEYPVSVSLSVNEDLTVGENSKIDAYVPLHDFSFLAENLTIARDFASFVEDYRSLLLAVQPEIENVFLDKIRDFNPAKIRDQITVEDKARLMVGNVIKEEWEQTSFHYENDESGKSVRILNDEWRKGSCLRVCTGVTAGHIKSRSFYPDENRFGSEDSYGNYYFEKLTQTGDREALSDREDSFRNHFMENIEPPAFVKEAFPKFPKPALTLEAFEAEFAYQVSEIFFYHGDLELGSSGEYCEKYYREAGKKALLMFSGKDRFDVLLKEEKGVTSDEGFVAYLTELAEKTSRIGIEKTAEELIRESNASFFRNSEVPVQESTPDSFNPEAILKEIRGHLEAGTFPSEFSSPEYDRTGQLNEAYKAVSALIESGSYNFGNWSATMHKDNYDAVRVFLENRGVKSISWDFGSERLQVFTPGKYPEVLEHYKKARSMKLHDNEPDIGR